jgi:hypothetical protein
VPQGHEEGRQTIVLRSSEQWKMYGRCARLPRSLSTSRRRAPRLASQRQRRLDRRRPVARAPDRSGPRSSRAGGAGSGLVREGALFGGAPPLAAARVTGLA